MERFPDIIILVPERNTRERGDDGSLSVDVSGVLKDFLEMDVDLDVPSAPEMTKPALTPNQELEVKDQSTLPLVEAATTSLQGRQAIQRPAGRGQFLEADQFLDDSHDQELNPKQTSALLSENNEYSLNDDNVPLQLANLSTESIDERTSVGQERADDVANSTRFATLVNPNPFSINESLTLPVPFATLPPKELLQQQWIGELQRILLKIPQGLAPISLVSADYKFREVLINWLIAAMTQAHPPLTHVIVFSLDQPLCDLLKGRNIYCIFVAPKAFLLQNVIVHLKKHVAFSEVMVLRLTAMRLMNHWGYDTANYDTDAIVLKSPESLYLRSFDSHLIGSYGHFPGELDRKWGTTVCCGLFMIKSSPYTGTQTWSTLRGIM